MNNEQRRFLAETVFRVLFSVIFITAGLMHVLKPAAVAHRLEVAPLGHLVTWAAPAQFLVLAAGVALLLGGVALLIGVRTRIAALLLIAVLIPITITVQIGGGEDLGPLFKNIAILGGLIHFAAVGATGASVDCVLERRAR